VSYAQAAALPRRYIVCFGGQSLGGDGDPLHNDYVPNTVGPNYDLKSALAPLAAVQGEVSVVSGLSIPTANGGSVPAGGRRDDFHVSSLSPLLSGVRSPDNTSSAGPTSDQIVADAIAGNTAFKTLAYRIQAEWYLSVSAPYGRDIISYRKNPSGGAPLAIAPVVSPRAAFDALFSNFTPPNDAAAAARQDFCCARGRACWTWWAASCNDCPPTCSWGAPTSSAWNVTPTRSERSSARSRPCRPP